MSAATDYFDTTLNLLQELKRTQTPQIEKAADICAERIARGGLIFLFGSGHSRMMCEEMTPRQGCFPGFVAMVELALSNHASIVGTNSLRAALKLEQCEGYAEEMLSAFKFGPDDGFILISTSGLRPVIVEMAMGAKKRGLPVIGIVSRRHSDTAPAGHASGKKLADIADVVIDNHAPPGDCVMEIEGLEWRTGPVSTVTGGMIINMIRCGVAERLAKTGHKLELLPSHQFVGHTGAREQLEKFYDAYRRSLGHLYR